MSIFKYFLVIAAFAASCTFALAEDNERFSFAGDEMAGGDELAFTTEIAGDIFAAGNNISITAPTGGDVHAAGFSIQVRDDVSGNVYAMGNSISISGQVGADVSVMGNTITLEGSDGIKGNVRAAGNSITIATPIGGSLLLGGNNITIDAPIDGDVRFSGNTLDFGGRAVINGTLHITSSSDIEVPQSVISADRITYERVEPGEETRNPVERMTRGPGWVPFLFGLIGLLVLGTIWLALFPKRSEIAYRTLTAKPFKSLLFGVLGLATIIGLIPVLAITLIGIPLIPIAIAALILTCLIGYIAGVFFLAARIAEAFGFVPDTMGRKVLLLAVGLIIGALIWMVPFIGWLLQLIVFFGGWGGITLAALGRWINSSFHQAITDEVVTPSTAE